MNKVFVRKINHSSDINELLLRVKFSEMFSKGEKVLIKPNFVAPRENKTGATTNLKLIKVISDKLHEIGAKPVLIETPGMEYKVKEVFDFLDIFEFAKENNIELIIPEKDDFIEVNVLQHEAIRSIRVPRIVLECKIINIPIMKTHVVTTVTLGMKNLMGLCDDQTKRKMHIVGIHRSIRDLNKTIKPELTIIDAINCMEGDGAVYGNVIKSNYLFASKNTGAVDLTACEFMGIDVKKVKHLSGLSFQDNLKIDGNFDRMNFTIPDPGKVYNFFYRGLYIVDVLFEKLFSVHFNKFLYKTGYFGTRPKITSECNECGLCIETCPQNAIDIEKKKINYKTCLRCLRCYEVCSNNAIIVKGFSNPQSKRTKNV